MPVRLHGVLIMAKTTKIQWADATWNPFIGCSKVSPACDNCYAEGWAKRCGRDFSKVVRAATGTFHAPLTWKEPKRIFVCSLSDFFHADILRADRHNAIKVMRDAPQHTYMLLTKRPENIKPMLAGTAWAEALPPNVWVGVTAENQEQADKRIPLLLKVPAHVRFVSCEPLLGEINFRWKGYAHLATGETYREYLERTQCIDEYEGLRKLNWVICGGESGGQARPMHPEWAKTLRFQCAETGVPFMFKQWGEWSPEGDINHPRQVVVTDDGKVYEPKDLAYPHGARTGEAIRANYPHHMPLCMKRVGKAAAGRLLDGVEFNGVPA